MVEIVESTGSFTFFPEHVLTELAGHEYPARQSGPQGRVLLEADILQQDHQGARLDLGPVITRGSVEMIAVFDGADGVFTEGNV